MNKQSLNEEGLTSISIDKTSRIANLIVAQVGFLINLFHLFILLRKELRTTAVFTIIRFICICDIVMLLTSFFDDFHLTMDFGKSDYCLGYNSYSMKVLEVVSMFLNGSALIISSWLTVFMALFRTLSIKYAMKSWADFFSKKSVAVWVSAVIGIIPPFYLSISTYLKYEITEKQEEQICLQYSNNQPNITITQYGLMPKEDETFEKMLFLFSLLDAFLMLTPLITDFVLTILLIKAIRKQKKLETAMRVLRDKSTSTSGLILVMLLSYIVSEVPPIVMNILVSGSTADSALLYVGFGSLLIIFPCNIG